jgi:membrane-associated phospholipid phosphatase
MERRFFKDLLRDQGVIWTSPLRLRGRDAAWLAPLTVATGALIATDRRTAGSLDNNPTRLRVSRDISYLGALYTTAGASGVLYLAGRGMKDRRLRETGLLGMEALADGLVVYEGLKAATQRPRPLKGGGRGRFFTRGNSFPSGHSVSAWTFATVVAKEYGDRPLVQLTTYGLAAAVGVSRFTARKHFLSDVLVGGAIGYGRGSYVYRDRRARYGAAAQDGQKSGTTPSLLPALSPLYDRRARAFGLSAKWDF